MKIQSVLHPWKSQIIHTFEPYTNMYILDKRHISDVIRRLYVHSRCNCKRGYSKLLYFWKNVFHMKFSKGDKKAFFSQESKLFSREYYVWIISPTVWRQFWFSVICFDEFIFSLINASVTLKSSTRSLNNSLG